MARRTKKRKAKAPRLGPMTVAIREVLSSPSPPRRGQGGATSGGNPPRRSTRATLEAKVAEAYQIVFGSEFGRIVKADLLQFANVFSPINESDPITLGMRMGERNMALRITQMLGLRPEHFDTEAWGAAETLNGMIGA